MEKRFFTLEEYKAKNEAALKAFRALREELYKEKYQEPKPNDMSQEFVEKWGDLEFARSQEGREG